MAAQGDESVKKSDASSEVVKAVEELVSSLFFLYKWNNSACIFVSSVLAWNNFNLF